MQDEKKIRHTIDRVWSYETTAYYLHIITVADQEKLRAWINDVVSPIEHRQLEFDRIQKEKASKKGYFAGWFTQDHDEDDFQAFFKDIDAEFDTEGKSSSYIRENTSLSLTFKVTYFSMIFDMQSEC